MHLALSPDGGKDKSSRRRGVLSLDRAARMLMVIPVPHDYLQDEYDCRKKSKTRIRKSHASCNP